MTIAFDELRKRWRNDPDFRKEYDALKPEFRLARELIEARTAARLSEGEVASRMGTSQPAIARMESGQRPRLRSLQRYAGAVGRNLEIHLVAERYEPIQAENRSKSAFRPLRPSSDSRPPGTRSTARLPPDPCDRLIRGRWHLR